MYTIQENVRIAVAALKLYGIKSIVVSPGGTNIPLVQALQDDPFFSCYSVVDERSAMYFAIGLHLKTGEIVATSCTSAQATRNYLPGLTEAYYKHVPILAITTSKLSRFQYQDYMQAPDQTSLLRDAVKGTYDIQPVTDVNTRVEAEGRIREAILELTHGLAGPVQLNLRIADAEQGKFASVGLPAVRKVVRHSAWQEWGDVSLVGRRVLVVIGEHRPFNAAQREALEEFCRVHDAAVYVNHLSNYKGEFAVQANLLVSCGGFRRLVPDVVITIGGQTGDYPIYGALKSAPVAELWRICEDGAVVDTYGKLTDIFQCPAEHFFRRMASGVPPVAKHQYLCDWKDANSSMRFDVDGLPLSNLYVAQQLHDRIPAGSVMNFAILNSLRCWSYFPLRPTIDCFANVAAFGIDGCTSMLIGESVATEGLCFLVTGDLAFFYDLNSLGIRHVGANVRILLINNRGGAEFKIMTAKWVDDLHTDDFISAGGHNGASAKGWATNCGFKYLCAHDKGEFVRSVDAFVSGGDEPVLFEVFTTEQDELAAMNVFLAANQRESRTVKQEIMALFGASAVKAVKRIVR